MKFEQLDISSQVSFLIAEQLECCLQIRMRNMSFSEIKFKQERVKEISTTLVKFIEDLEKVTGGRLCDT